MPGDQLPDDSRQQRIHAARLVIGRGEERYAEDGPLLEEVASEVYEAVTGDPEGFHHEATEEQQEWKVGALVAMIFLNQWQLNKQHPRH